MSADCNSLRNVGANSSGQLEYKEASKTAKVYSLLSSNAFTKHVATRTFEENKVLV